MIRHIVAEGQTPAELAERYGVALADLVHLNGLNLTLPVPAGMMLWVPEPPAVRPLTTVLPDPVLRVPATLFDRLSTWQEPDGSPVRLRIVRSPGDGPLELQFPK